HFLVFPCCSCLIRASHVLYSPASSALSLHDALPILLHRRNARLPARQRLHANLRPSVRTRGRLVLEPWHVPLVDPKDLTHARYTDRKSTRLNSSHESTSYAVGCLNKTRPSRYGACTA